MPVVVIANHRIDLAWPAVSDSPREHDRQLSWSIYAEILNCRSLCGRLDEQGELASWLVHLPMLFEDLDRFSKRFGELLTTCPAPAAIVAGHPAAIPLAIHLSRIQELVLKPFLDRWQVPFTTWWQSHSSNPQSPLAAEEDFADRSELLIDLQSVQTFFRETIDEIGDGLGIPPPLGSLPPAARQAWLDQTRSVWSRAGRSDHAS